jgi:DNA-directed RNA polymerase sigma subunit (sigma70/sigma32)
MTKTADDVPMTETPDPVLEALDALAEMIRVNTERNHEMLEQIRYVKEERAKGLGYRQITEAKDGPLIVELATLNLESLTEAACRLRRAEAGALHDEGLTMDRIAELFGVTRQRISQVLRSRGTNQHVA